MLNSLLKALNSEYEPYLILKDFEKLDNNLKEFFLQKYLETYSCPYCSERCSKEYFQENGKFYIDCPEGIIETKKEINIDSLKRYMFCVSKLFQKLSEANNITLNSQIINNNNSYIIGYKFLSKSKTQYFYLSKLSLKNFIQQIYSISEYFKNANENVLITPMNLNLAEKDLSLLESYKLILISLESVFKNDFKIYVEDDLSKYLFIVDAENLRIIIAGLTINLSSSIQMLTFAYNISLNPMQKTSSEILTGKKKTHNLDKTVHESARKLVERLLNKIKEEFNKSSKDCSILENLIVSLHKEESFYLNLNAEKVKTIGMLPE